MLQSAAARTRAACVLVVSLLVLAALCEARFRLQPPEFMLIGQMKSGTSSLWKYLSSHPQIASPRSKELLYWAIFEEHCGRDVLTYFKQLQWSPMNRVWKPGRLLGEFSATYLSCACCATMLRSFNPYLKLVVMVRHPIARAMSRYNEAKARSTGDHKPLPGHVAGEPFVYTFERDKAAIVSCMDNVTSAIGDNTPHAYGDRFHNASVYYEDSSITGGGLMKKVRKELFMPRDGHTMRDRPGMQEARERMEVHMRAQCASRGQYVGDSLYDVFLDHWLNNFPKEQIHVILTEDLDARPEEEMARLEDFLGISHHRYNETFLHARYNGVGCMGWTCADLQDARKRAAAAAADGNGDDDDDGDEDEEEEEEEEGARRRRHLRGSRGTKISTTDAQQHNSVRTYSEDLVRQALGVHWAEAVEFFRPTVKRLAAWAAEGVMLRKGPLPPAYDDFFR